MQAVINFIIANLKAIWPVSRVYTWQCGLLIRGGLIRRELAPGLHMRWSILEEVYSANSTEQTVHLPTCAITTSDGRSVAIAASVAYRIVSLRTMWSAVSNIDKSLTNVALGFLSTECTKRSWHDLTQRHDQVQAELVSHMSKQLEAWGVEVTRLYLTDLVEARHYRLFGDSPLVRA